MMALRRRLVGPRHIVTRLRLWPGLIIVRRRPLIIPLLLRRIISLRPRSVILRRPRLVVTRRGRIIAFRPGLVSGLAFRPAVSWLLALFLMPRLRMAGFLTGRTRRRIVVMILREARRCRQDQHRDVRGQPVPKLRRCFHPNFPPEFF